MAYPTCSELCTHMMKELYFNSDTLRNTGTRMQTDSPTRTPHKIRELVEESALILESVQGHGYLSPANRIRKSTRVPKVSIL